MSALAADGGAAAATVQGRGAAEGPRLGAQPPAAGASTWIARPICIGLSLAALLALPALLLSWRQLRSTTLAGSAPSGQARAVCDAYLGESGDADRGDGTRPEERPLEARVEAALLGALAADAAARQGRYDATGLQAALADGGGSAAHSPFGEELLHALEVVSSTGFEFHAFSASWRSWAEGRVATLTIGSLEALGNLAVGTPADTAASHYIDLGGAARVPALLLLAGLADDASLALAGRELQAVTHENPKALQAGELLLRAALWLLRRPPPADTAAGCSPEPPDAALRRRAAIADALRAAAAEAGPQYLEVIDNAVSEAQSREAVDRALAGRPAGALQGLHDDAAVLGRLTSSGHVPGQEVHGGLVPYVMPAIVWLAVAYGSFEEAMLANLKLGGETAARGLFVGLLLAARDGPVPLGAGALSAWPGARLRAEVPPFIPPLRLCAFPGHCQAVVGAGERRMHGVASAAAVVALAPRGRLSRYRIYLRLDASELLGPPEEATALTKPSDWNDDEDGHWEPPAADKAIECLARYFQFTTRSGRHAPFGLWPAGALCRLSPAAPAAHDSFDVLLPEPLAHVIGGVSLNIAGRDVKLPSMLVGDDAEAAEPPPWAHRSTWVGAATLPEGTWRLAA